MFPVASYPIFISFVLFIQQHYYCKNKKSNKNDVN